jgi:ribonuclease-3
VALDGALGPDPEAGALTTIMASRRPPLTSLEDRIGHRFAEPAHLERALTHITSLPGTPANGPHYQRLEYLGDRVLGLVIADLLYRSFPQASEGDLSRRLGHLVRRETCAEVARAWDVQPHVRAGQGAETTQTVLADVCEAIIAAVYLDAGFEAARGVVEGAFGPLMGEPQRALRDAKSALQEWAMARALPPPVYREIDRTGPDHAPMFRIGALVEGFPASEGQGRSKRIAEQAAAEAFLRREGAWHEVAS